MRETEVYVTISIQDGDKLDNYVDSMWMASPPSRGDLVAYRRKMYTVVQRVWEWPYPQIEMGPGLKATIVIEENSE